MQKMAQKVWVLERTTEKWRKERPTGQRIRLLLQWAKGDVLMRTELGQETNIFWSPINLPW